MKANSLLSPLSIAAFALLSAPAVAGDIDVTFRGTVEYAQSASGTPAQLAGLVQGDAVSFTASVFAAGVPASLGGTAYGVDAAGTSLTTPAGTLAADMSAAAGTVELIDGMFDPMSADLSDLIVAQQELEGGVSAGSAAAWIDTWFPNEDLASQIGTIYDLTFAGDATIVGLSLSDASGGYVSVRITEVEISAPGARFFQTKYCPAVANSTGEAARIAATGSVVVAENQLTLSCEGLPVNSFGYYIASSERALVAGPGGSQGTLCLGGQIGRFSRPGEIRNSGIAGTVSIDLNLADMPSPTGSVAVLPGQTMQFSYWYRDANPGVTSNFADAIEITFE